MIPGPIRKAARQKDKKNQEEFKMDTQIKHAKIQLRNYYHMEINKNKEGENKWQE